MGKALHAYDMIANDDRIAVGLSGGKDSWALLWLLAERQPRVPVNYSLFPIHIDLGFGGDGAVRIDRYSRRMGWSVRIEFTDIGRVAHSEVNRENPCFLCARRRRQRLFETAEALGCNKLALGHNKDDIIETFFLNMLYAGEMSTMRPSQSFFQGRLTVIRPLAYTEEADLRRFSRKMEWPIVENPCPSAGRSRRSAVKSVLERLYCSNDKIKGNIFRAMRHIRPEYLLR
jgi:tRNA 2-thiocytidine biosynthesis protein TtcA